MSRKPNYRRSVASSDERGSVLIFVVGVLLLLAIIATAFLGSSRSDRTATQQNAYNTQIDLLLDGVVNAMKGTILGDARYNLTANGFDAFTDDKYLAARLPTLSDPTVFTATAASLPVWNHITAPQLDTVFSYPMPPSSIGNPPATYTARDAVYPGYLNYNGQKVPAFIFNTNADYTQPYAYSLPVPAIDADGDGVADAGMVKLPVGQIAGVTYYYGARIVDLNSAINVNTAWTSNDPTAAGGYDLPANFFPSNLDLQGLLTGATAAQGTQMTALNVDRTGSLGGFNLTPIDDYRMTPFARTDFTFAGTTTTSADALWMQLGRRLQNPGYDTAAQAYVPFSVASSVQLASQFVVRNASVSNLPVETALLQSLVTPAPTKPYQPDDTINWFNTNFAFPDRSTGTANQTMPLRSLLTTTNTVADDSGGSDATVTAWAAGATNYTFGQIVSRQLPGSAVSRDFVCLATNTPALANAPETVAGTAYWGLLGWSKQPQRIDINTADFGELWAGFRRLMATSSTLNGSLDLPPFPLMPYAATTKGRQFRNPVRDPAATPQFPAQPGKHLTPSEMLQVRTAIAAVNAMDIRDTDTNVTARQITTYDFTTSPPTALHTVTVFGNEAQPYITEVYYNNDNLGTGGGGALNPDGYVAVELFNPTSAVMNLAGWSLGLIDRSTGTYPRTIVPALESPTRKFEAADVVTVPAGGYLVLENYYDVPGGAVVIGGNGGAGTPDPSDALHRPTGVAVTAGVTVRYVPGLARVISGATTSDAVSTGGELVLLRPRIWSPDGTNTLTTSAVGTAGNLEDPHNEVAPGATAVNLSDWVPVDSFDFSGMTVPPAGAATFNAWHYTRANDTANTWKCTHGGPYAPGAAPILHQGEMSPAFAPDTAPTFPSGAPVALGAADATPSFPDAHVATQVNASGSPSPYRATAAVNNQTPFGAFALQTDLMQVPFIGSYTVRDPATDTVAGTVPGTFTEMNALPMDWGFADDQDDDGADPAPLPPGGNDNAYEQVGRFCPLSTLDPVTYKNWPNTAPLRWSAAGASPVDWYDFGYTAVTTTSRTIFDLFTTQSPLNPALPATSADAYAAAIGADPTQAVIPASVASVSVKKPPSLSFSTAASASATSVQGRANLSDVTDAYKGMLLQMISGDQKGAIAVISGSDSTQTLTLMSPGLPAAPAPGDAFRILGTPLETAGTDGLVNINTAPWPVLARLPLAFNAAGQVDHGVSETVARQIVLYRDGNPLHAGTGASDVDQRTPHGPFRSIADLNKVLDPTGVTPTFQTLAAQSMPLVMTNDYGTAAGDLTPLAGADNVAGDYETRYLALSRISNLITTRSDKFVIYVALQGWRDAETNNAKMVTQRRAAFIVDRSAASATSPTLDSIKIPGN